MCFFLFFLLKKFHLLTKPIFDEMFTKQKQIINLIKSRDSMLSKLMSGIMIFENKKIEKSDCKRLTVEKKSVKRIATK